MTLEESCHHLRASFPICNINIQDNLLGEDIDVCYSLSQFNGVQTEVVLQLCGAVIIRVRRCGSMGGMAEWRRVILKRQPFLRFLIILFCLGRIPLKGLEIDHLAQVQCSEVGLRKTIGQ